MATSAQKPELLTIVGPTNSGKSDLALKLAKEFNGEIIAADSRTIYKGIDIGTAKPSKKEQEDVVHWGLDLITPGETYSAHRFKQFAETKIKDIQARGKLAILVGGTGLYIDAVLFDFSFVDSPERQRKHLENLSLSQLEEIIQKKSYSLPKNYKNRRHLMSTIKRKGETGVKGGLRKDAFLIGLATPPEELKKRINERAKQYFSKGIVSETKLLLKRYGEEEVLQCGGIAYKATMDFIKGKADKKEAVDRIQKEEWQYARRQKTWFKRNKFIHWFENSKAAYTEIATILNS